jgi:hypothetical protein
VPPTTYDDVADLLIDWAVREDRVRALWIESDRLTALRRPYAGLEVHLAADEPVYPALLAELSRGVTALPGSRVDAVEDTPRSAKCLRVTAFGLPLALVMEQSFLLAKRPRAEVVPLVDKTGHLTHVFDFSKRARP